jgi:hypothetical protein|tara:strand:+ start:357 stop:827 length:471 start_codon:yes stop_codon:yes gene_type:complete
MKLIAHRGNTHGPEEDKENSPDYIDKCLSEGFDAEIDARYDPLTSVFWLGHDEPQYKVSWKWMANRHELLWIHCKDITTLHEFAKYTASKTYNFFWHQEDDFTLTSHNYIWTFPAKPYTPKSIIVMPEWNTKVSNLSDWRAVNCFGICSDYVGHLK